MASNPLLEFIETVLMQSAVRGDGAVLFTFTDSPAVPIVTKIGLPGVKHFEISKKHLVEATTSIKK